MIMRLVDRVKVKNSVQEEVIDGESGGEAAETVEGKEAGKGEKPEAKVVEEKEGAEMKEGEEVKEGVEEKKEKEVKEEGEGKEGIEEKKEKEVKEVIEEKKEKEVKEEEEVKEGIEEKKVEEVKEVIEEKKAEVKEESKEQKKDEPKPAKEKKDSEGTVTCKAALDALPATTARLTITACKDYKSELLDFSRFTNLEELRIEKKCFDYPSKVKIEGLKKLKRVSIASGCFHCTNADSEMIVRDCPALEELKIGSHSFPSFKSLKMSGLPSLQRIHMGKECFKTVSLEVKKMESLETIVMGKNCFEKSLHTIIEGERRW